MAIAVLRFSSEPDGGDWWIAAASTAALCVVLTDRLRDPPVSIADLYAAQRGEIRIPRPSLTGRVLASIGLTFAWVPLIGMLLHAIALLVNNRRQGRATTLSAISLLLSVEAMLWFYLG